LSDPLDISASIVQGSVVGPASYVVAASDLHPVSSHNIVVSDDDIYLIFRLIIRIPAKPRSSISNSGPTAIALNSIDPSPKKLYLLS